MSKSLKSGLLAVCCLIGAGNAYGERDRGDRYAPRLWSYEVRNQTSTDQRGRDNQASQAQNGTANSSRVRQAGNNNNGTVSQNGASNIGSVRQIGYGNNAGISQDGARNTACIIQLGRRLDAGVLQTGNNNSSGIIQTHKGAKEVPAALCLMTDFAIGELQRELLGR